MQTVSMKRLNELVEDEHFNQLLKQLHEEQKFALNRETWFNHIHSGGDLNLVAYFCMEYGLSEALPLYSGGLGVLAGDHLKTSNDLGIPLVAVGLLYQQGYFRQTINNQGEQLEFYPLNDPSHACYSDSFYWTVMIRSISRQIAGSPVNFMAAALNYV